MSSISPGKRIAETRENLEDVDALFVQSAAGFASDERSVTLLGVSPATLYLADRPRREVGHISSRRFVDAWNEGENSLLVDPPNAVLAFLGDEETQPGDAVVILFDPRLRGDALTYMVEVIEGELPERGGPCSLFIDAFGRRESPISLAGVHRRERRPIADHPIGAMRMRTGAGTFAP